MSLRQSKSLSPRPQSPAQQAATTRNFRVFNLRGLYQQARILTGLRRAAVQALIDDELAAIGAETEAARKVRREAEWAALDAKRTNQFAEVGADIPF